MGTAWIKKNINKLFFINNKNLLDSQKLQYN